MQLRLDKYGHIIGTEYLNDLVEKEHGTHNHGILCCFHKDKTNVHWTAIWIIVVSVPSVYIVSFFCSL